MKSFSWLSSVISFSFGITVRSACNRSPGKVDRRPGDLRGQLGDGVGLGEVDGEVGGRRPAARAERALQEERGGGRGGRGRRLLPPPLGHSRCFYITLSLIPECWTVGHISCFFVYYCQVLPLS